MHNKRQVFKKNNNLFLKQKKKGLSTVIANLIIILLVLVALGIIWVVIRSVVTNGSKQINLGQFTISLKIENAYFSGTNIVVQTRRDPGAGDLVGIKFIFANATESTVVDRNVSLNELDVRSFIFTPAEISGIVAGDHVSVAPVYSSSGSVQVSQPTDSATIAGAPPAGSGSQGTGSGGSVCGNGNLEAGEQCDDGNTINGDGCSASCTIETSLSCNNDGILDPGEICDGLSLGGKTCQSLGFDSGQLSCNSCSFDTSQCVTSNPFCGDLIQQPGEQCDAGTQNGVPGSGCSSSCTAQTSNTCNNDNHVDAGENCDGTDLNGKTCQSFGYDSGSLSCIDCHFEFSQCVSPVVPVCGNGIPEGNEQCDLGPTLNGALGSGCSIDCKLVVPSACDGTWNQSDISAGNQCDGGAHCSLACSCPVGFSPDGLGGCSLNPPLDTGVIHSVWYNYFDSQNLPKNIINVTALIGDYVNFTNSLEPGCFQITFADYVAENDTSYLRLDKTQGIANINAGQRYSVWQAVNCGL